MKYTFRCKACDKTFEIEHGMHEPHPAKCPECGGRLVRRFNKPNVHYHGSGFYTTDKVLYEPDPDLLDYYDDNEQPI